MNPPDARESHVDELAVAAYLEGRLPDGARDEVEAHLAECDECRRALVLLGGLDELEAEPVPRELLAAPRRRIGGAWAAAAAVLLGMLILLPLGEMEAPGADGLPVFRDAGGHGPALLFPEAGAVVSHDVLVFRWTPVEGAERYRVRVWNVESGFTAEFLTADGETEIGWPAGEPEPPPGELVWRVQALSLNRIVSESRPGSFEVRD